MGAGFAAVDAGFASLDERFATIDRTLVSVDAGITDVNATLGGTAAGQEQIVRLLDHVITRLNDA